MNDKPQTLQEETLDKLIGLIEGPANKLAEKVLSSKILLAPMSILLNVGFRVLARVAGRTARKEQK